MLRDVLIFLVAGFLGFWSVQSAHLPSSLKTCKTSDPSYDTCIKGAVENALLHFATADTSLSMPSIDPIFTKRVHIAGNGGAVDLDQLYEDISLSGFSKGHVLEFREKIDPSDCHIFVRLFVDSAHLTGKYKFTGKLLLFNLNGFGAVNITLVNTNTTHDIICDVVDKKGEKYLEVKDYKYTFAPGKLIYYLENVINGNDQLSEEVLHVMNDNDLEVFSGLKTDYQTTFGDIFKQIARQFFSKVPISELMFV